MVKPGPFSRGNEQWRGQDSKVSGETRDTEELSLEGAVDTDRQTAWNAMAPGQFS